MSTPKQGFKRVTVTELGTGATFALPVPVRDVLMQMHLVYPYPKSDQVSPFHVGFN